MSIEPPLSAAVARVKNSAEKRVQGSETGAATEGRPYRAFH
jgi:hypothetical protein